MALSPKQMGAAIIKNLSTKTGKSLDEWLSIVKKTKLNDKKSIISLLKTKHSLGHFQAQAISNEYLGQDDYANPDALIKTLFNTKELMASFRNIEKEILKIDDSINVQPCKTYIPFYSKNQFAIVKPFRKKHIMLGVNLPRNFHHDRFKTGKSAGSARINFHTILETPKDFDTEIIDILKMAFLNNSKVNA